MWTIGHRLLIGIDTKAPSYTPAPPPRVQGWEVSLINGISGAGMALTGLTCVWNHLVVVFPVSEYILRQDTFGSRPNPHTGSLASG